jgi:hypothetical protein
MVENERLDDRLLDAFIDGFYGYGSFAALIWFVSIYEGGGKSIAEIAKRLSNWATRGQTELEDLAQFHEAIGKSRWVSSLKPRLQSTWRPLIRVQLQIEGNDFAGESAKNQNRLLQNYQAEQWGRRDAGNCLMAVMPLWSPAKENWLYPDSSSLP